MKLVECGTDESVNVYALLDNESLQQALAIYLNRCYKQKTRYGSEYIVRKLYLLNANDAFISIERVLNMETFYYSSLYEIHFEPGLLPNIPYNTIYTLEEFMKEVNVC